MRLPSQDRARHVRGASGVEYVVVVVMLAMASIGGYKLLDKKYRCKISQATGLFALTGEKGAAVNCDDEGSAQASNTPPPSNAPPGGPGPASGVTCVGTSCTPGSGSCFVAGTLVTTESGPRPIETIEPGTRVLSRAEEGGELEFKPVLRTFRRSTQSLVRLEVVDGSGHEERIELTPEHRLHANGRGWIAAEELIPGRDTLQDRDGAPLVIASGEAVAEETTVFNMEVAEDHTYFVGTSGLWAHNFCGYAGYACTGPTCPHNAPPTAGPGPTPDVYSQFQNFSNGEFDGTDGGRYPIPFGYGADGCWGRADCGTQMFPPHMNPGYAYTDAHPGSSLQPPGGAVNWGYHVAPTVTDGHGNTWVMDPSVSGRPQTTTEWQNHITPPGNNSTLTTSPFPRLPPFSTHPGHSDTFTNYGAVNSPHNDPLLGGVFGSTSAPYSPRPPGVPYQPNPRPHTPVSPPWGGAGALPGSTRNTPLNWPGGDYVNHTPDTVYIKGPDGKTHKVKPGKGVRYF